ncbi:hypothetical protein NPIL_454551 [Nephila pilipes]|uniref:Uncharacterized protein n=1 Tax=Nephila pilipes TaxID=299642 RepID=A0A8X6PBP2_NEPPI|nr:hypothetical protein NPIL_454551 [Nephila pilipes]
MVETLELLLKLQGIDEAQLIAISFPSFSGRWLDSVSLFGTLTLLKEYLHAFTEWEGQCVYASKTQEILDETKRERTTIFSFKKSTKNRSSASHPPSFFKPLAKIEYGGFV